MNPMYPLPTIPVCPLPTIPAVPLPTISSMVQIPLQSTNNPQHQQMMVNNEWNSYQINPSNRKGCNYITPISR